MLKYAKLIDPETGLCDVGLGTNNDFYKSIGMAELDVEQSEIDGNWYLSKKCPHYTDEELAQQEKEKRKAEIKAELEALDAEAVRPLRAKITGNADEDDDRILNEIEEKVKALRAEYHALEV